MGARESKMLQSESSQVAGSLRRNWQHEALANSLNFLANVPLASPLQARISWK